MLKSFSIILAKKSDILQKLVFAKLSYTFDFQKSTIIAFIHDSGKRRIVEGCSIFSYNTIFSSITRFPKI